MAQENTVDPTLFSGSFPDFNHHKKNICVYMYVYLCVYVLCRCIHDAEYYFLNYMQVVSAIPTEAPSR